MMDPYSSKLRSSLHDLGEIDMKSLSPRVHISKISSAYIAKKLHAPNAINHLSFKSFLPQGLSNRKIKESVATDHNYAKSIDGYYPDLMVRTPTTRSCKIRHRPNMDVVLIDDDDDDDYDDESNLSESDDDLVITKVVVGEKSINCLEFLENTKHDDHPKQESNEIHSEISESHSKNCNFTGNSCSTDLMSLDNNGSPGDRRAVDDKPCERVTCHENILENDVGDTSEFRNSKSLDNNEICDGDVEECERRVRKRLYRTRRRTNLETQSSGNISDPLLETDSRCSNNIRCSNGNDNHSLSNCSNRKVYNTRKRSNKTSSSNTLNESEIIECDDNSTNPDDDIEHESCSPLSDFDPRKLSYNALKKNNDDLATSDNFDVVGIGDMKRVKAVRWDHPDLDNSKQYSDKCGMLVRNITIENICKFNNIHYSKSVVYRTQFSKIYVDEINMLLSIYPVESRNLNSVNRKVKRKRKVTKKMKTRKAMKSTFNETLSKNVDDGTLSRDTDNPEYLASNYDNCEFSRNGSPKNYKCPEECKAEMTVNEKVNGRKDTISDNGYGSPKDSFEDFCDYSSVDNNSWIFDDDSPVKEERTYRKKFASEHSQNKSELMDSLRRLREETDNLLKAKLESAESQSTVNGFIKKVNTNVKSYPLRNRHMLVIG